MSSGHWIVGAHSPAAGDAAFGRLGNLQTVQQPYSLKPVTYSQQHSKTGSYKAVIGGFQEPLWMEGGLTSYTLWAAHEDLFADAERFGTSIPCAGYEAVGKMIGGVEFKSRWWNGSDEKIQVMFRYDERPKWVTFAAELTTQWQVESKNQTALLSLTVLDLVKEVLAYPGLHDEQLLALAGSSLLPAVNKFSLQQNNRLTEFNSVFEQFRQQVWDLTGDYYEWFNFNFLDEFTRNAEVKAASDAHYASVPERLAGLELDEPFEFALFDAAGNLEFKE